MVALGLAIGVGSIVALEAQALGTGTCGCGPDFCQNDPRYLLKLKEKKAKMLKEGYPNDLVALMDLDSVCLARVERAPDGFSIKVVKPGGSLTLRWSTQDEAISKQQVLAGEALAYYKFNVNRRFSCCEEPPYDQRPDWNTKLELNLGLAIKCSKQGSSVACESPK